MSYPDPYLPPDEGPVELNPYAPPASDLSGRYSPSGPGRPAEWLEPFSVDAVMRRAWRVYQDQLGLSIGLVVGVWALGYAVTVPGNLVLAALQAGGVPQWALVVAAFAYMIGSAAFGLWMYSGQALALVKLVRGQDTAFGDVFRGGRYVIRMVLASLVVWACTAVAAGLASIPVIALFFLFMDEPTGLRVTLGLLVGVLAAVAVIGLTVRLYLYPYALVDLDCGPVEAVRQSYEMTRGHVFELVALAVIAFLVNLLGFLMCFLGLIFTVPLSMLIGAGAYALLAGPGPVGFTKKGTADIEFLDFDT